MTDMVGENKLHLKEVMQTPPTIKKRATWLVRDCLYSLSMKNNSFIIFKWTSSHELLTN